MEERLTPLAGSKRGLVRRFVPRFIPLALYVICFAVAAFALARVIFHAVPNDQAVKAPAGMALASAALAAMFAIFALEMELGMTAPREHPWATLRRFFFVVVAIWIAFLLWAQPYSRVRLEIAAAITVGVFALLRTLEPLFARLPRKLRRAGDIVLFNICLTLVAGELGLRAYAYFKPSQIFARIGSSPLQRIEDMREKPGKVRYTFPCNSIGEYDDEFRPRAEGEHLVATIGDSFSFGVVPHAYHFTTVCERAIGTPVANVGVPAIDTQEYDYLLEHEALPLNPEVVVVDIFVGNDLVFVYEITPTFDPFFRSWLDRRNALLWLVPDRMMRIAEEQNSRTGDQGPLGSAQGELAGPLDLPAASLEERYPWLADPMQESRVGAAVSMKP